MSLSVTAGATAGQLLSQGEDSSGVSTRRTDAQVELPAVHVGADRAGRVSLFGQMHRTGADRRAAEACNVLEEVQADGEAQQAQNVVQVALLTTGEAALHDSIVYAGCAAGYLCRRGRVTLPVNSWIHRLTQVTLLSDSPA